MSAASTRHPKLKKPTYNYEEDEEDELLRSIQQEKDHLETLNTLQRRTFELETELQKAQTANSVQTQQEQLQNQTVIRQLNEKVQMLEELNHDLRQSKLPFASGPGVQYDAHIGDKSAGLGVVWESRVRDLMVRWFHYFSSNEILNPTW